MKKTKRTKQRHVLVCSLLVMMLLWMPAGKLSSQEILTIAEVYDYEVGDIFHYYKWGQNYTKTKGGMWSVTNITILNSYYSADEDTLFYVRDVDYQVVFSPDPNPNYEFYTDTIFYTNLNSLLNSGDVDSVYSDAERFNGRTINFLNFSDYYSTYTEEFAAGCGKVSDYFYSESRGSESKDELVYYKKGGEEWGSEIIVSVESPESQLLQYSLFPNPAADVFHIITNNSVRGEATLFSSGGSRLGTFVLNPQKTSIDISNLEPGLYVFSIQLNHEIISKKLLKE